MIIDFLRNIFGKPQEKPTHRQTEERPPDWNLTISDLMDEMKAGKRKSVGSPELDWARDYTRSLIPKGTRFPVKGDVYESLEDQTISYLTAWSAPFTGSGEATLLKGEQIWIDSEPAGKEPLGVYALPIEYAKLEERMVPETERTAPKYGGFYFYINSIDLNTSFRLAGTDYSK